MTDKVSNNEQNTPPASTEIPSDALVKQVRQALRHLYNLPYLQSLTLARVFAWDQGGIAQPAGQRLQQELLLAIQKLDPGAHVPASNPRARIYNLLRLRYINRQTVDEAARSLGISSRQAHRDLRRGEENVAATLWTRRHLTTMEETESEQLSSPQAEIALLETRPKLIDLCELLHSAQAAVAGIAAAHGIDLRITKPQHRVEISTDPIIARQVLISLLSRVTRQAEQGSVLVSLETESADVIFRLRYYAKQSVSVALTADPVTLQLAQRLNWSIQETQIDEEQMTIVRLASNTPVILVIDDNAGLVRLLERYLADQQCQVLVAADGHEGIRLARQSVPDAIVLDVMMPEMDGWEVLQWIRNNLKTAHIPVVVCSVIDDPELAYSLGASLFVRKPVTRGSILTSLSQLGIIAPHKPKERSSSA